MHCYYKDILSRFDGPPEWWDENAVPRFCPFRPEHVANIYAREVALVEIACQNCGRRFDVAFSWHSWAGVIKDPPERISKRIERRCGIEYGDPPNARCCPAGPTMTSDTIRVLQFWRRDGGCDWQRDKGLEIELGSPSRRPS